MVENYFIFYHFGLTNFIHLNGEITLFCASVRHIDIKSPEVDKSPKNQGITEALKAKDQMAWVGTMNNIRNAAEEIILAELIYS